MKKIEALIKEQNIWNYIVLHAHNPEVAKEYASRMKKITGLDPFAVADISPVIGMNAGVGATAVSMMLT